MAVNGRCDLLISVQNVVSRLGLCGLLGDIGGRSRPSFPKSQIWKLRVVDRKLLQLGEMSREREGGNTGFQGCTSGDAVPAPEAL